MYGIIKLRKVYWGIKFWFTMLRIKHSIWMLKWGIPVYFVCSFILGVIAIYCQVNGIGTGTPEMSAAAGLH